MVALKYLIMRDKIFIANNMEYMLLVKHAGVSTNSNHMPKQNYYYLATVWQHLNCSYSL